MNYIIIATSTDGTREYVSSTRHETLSEDANDAARFVQLDSALEAARVLIEQSDFERNHNVVLTCGLVKTVVDKEISVPRKAKKPGFIIVFKHPSSDGPYSIAPKKPKEFDYQHCTIASENIDRATRYSTREEAAARVELMKKTVYETCAQYSAYDRKRWEDAQYNKHDWMYGREFIDTWGERAKQFKVQIKEV